MRSWEEAQDGGGRPALAEPDSPYPRHPHPPLGWTGRIGARRGMRPSEKTALRPGVPQSRTCSHQLHSRLSVVPTEAHPHHTRAERGPARRLSPGASPESDLWAHPLTMRYPRTTPVLVDQGTSIASGAPERRQKGIDEIMGRPQAMSPAGRGAFGSWRAR